MVQIAMSAESSDQRIAPTSSRRCVVSNKSRTSGPKGKPSVPAARHTSPISRASSTRSRETMAAGTGSPWNGLDATLPRFCAQP